MKYMKFVLLGSIFALVFIPNILGKKMSVQRASGEVKPVVVRVEQEITQVISSANSYEIIDKTIIENDEFVASAVIGNVDEVAVLEIPKSQYDYQLVIPKIGVDAPVLGLGLEPDGRMDVPDNYEEVGWYSFGTKPGDVGNAVLGAHVDNGSSVSGVFKNLKDLQDGDVVYMIDKAGRQRTFKIISRKTYDYRTTNTEEVFGNFGKSQLVLITCHGTYLPSEGTYDTRLIITAERIA